MKTGGQAGVPAGMLSGPGLGFQAACSQAGGEQNEAEGCVQRALQEPPPPRSRASRAPRHCFGRRPLACVVLVTVMYSRGAWLASPANCASSTSLSICQGVGGAGLQGRASRVCRVCGSG